ncbi:RNA polymerase sigma factor [Dactylosporangium sp. NPDC000521]|uniref:RNA polymerase sigma factor n=1 Tax=Dactylosporangium sp. NPDC000521 TaxID=3363975 RepID=UPI0036CC9FF1
MRSASEDAFGDLLRSLAPQVLGALVRRYGHFDHAEDAVQEALIAAAAQWPAGGVPESPRGWLITVASRRLTDLLRSESARLRREAEWTPPPPSGAAHDDSLILLAMCCHPSLSPPDQIALTLRAVGGLTTVEVARAFLVPEATMARRISRAKQKIKASDVPFALPSGFSGAVLHVLYLMFNEGYAATAGPDLHRPDLAAEAIRLARLVHRLMPTDSEVAGLLALMLLTDARRPARTAADGTPVPMDAQDRTLWDDSLIAEGVALVTAALPRGPVGPYQLQAAIAALHDEAPSAAETDWPQIVALYELLLTLTDNPMVALNHAVAVTMASGPAAGLSLLSSLSALPALVHDHRFHAVLGHLLEMSGSLADARDAYTKAAGLTGSVPLRRYLHTRAAACQ